jgi:uncharacterized membrane protein YfcA
VRTVLLASVVVAIAAFVQASVGVGFAMIAVPLLLLLDPSLVPVPMLSAMLVLSTIMLLHERHHVDRASLGVLLPGLAVGTLIGATLAPFLPVNSAFVFGGLILAAVAWSVFGPPIVMTPANSRVAGVVAGAMGTVSGLHGPALAIAYQRHAPERARAIIAGVFVLAAALSVVALLVSGVADGGDLTRGAVLVPGTMAGFVTATLVPSPPPGVMRAGMLSVATASALLLFV